MKFTKMHGAGNDFILIDNRDGAVPETEYAALARSLCRRRLSLGADGLIVVLPPSRGGDYAMAFYNSDGSLGEMCGNGARCIARYGYEHGLAGETQRIETTAGMVIGRRVGPELYRVRLNDPTVLLPEVTFPEEDGLPPCAYAELGDPGIPHAVVRLDKWEETPRAELRELAKMIRFSPVFPRGANVTFWAEVEPNHVKAVTYERGVEDFTLACGTGAGSTAAVLRLMGLADGEVRLDYPGGTLFVTAEEADGKIKDLYLTGPAVTVAEGEVMTY